MQAFRSELSIESQSETTKIVNEDGPGLRPCDKCSQSWPGRFGTVDVWERYES